MSSKSNEGIGVIGILGIVFVVLKLTHVIDWPWWAVTLPFWGGLALGSIFVICVFLIAMAIGDD